ncbi:cAMP-binding domain of CRP or a regulatory subunit of cAMP-dependent protein kinases [Lutibacter maritimus]|uniref:cAMP-binding domain of CRP or a regulatory subunit of cAMP-dependent protein kinases n=1 Tax=Lutibacter maritimus TaxID=593133 RepID=A0A1I6SFF7_9FLAO|nr:cAMP-binding domain of CRP or a regulatory subunit of cAMP-dependent protein kinases [Lutibacter maritimus]
MDFKQQTQLLIKHLKQEVSLNKSAIEKLTSIIKFKELNKKEFLIKPGETANTMNFIVQGSMRSYYLDENGQEHTLQLGIEEWWINDLYSYLSRKKSRMYVQALEKTHLIRLPKVELEKLYIEVPAISNFFRIKIQSAYVAVQERVIDSMCDDAYERYDKFRKSYRDIEQRVPQYIIASYLGVTPEFLSYLRKKHS